MQTSAACIRKGVLKLIAAACLWLSVCVSADIQVDVLVEETALRLGPAAGRANLYPTHSGDLLVGVVKLSTAELMAGTVTGVLYFFT